ncbi:MAG: hypothetical protein AAGF95_06220 [Chloroflexota bacterium]
MTELLQHTLAIIDTERPYFADSFELVDQLLATYGENDLANRLYVDISEAVSWEIVVDLFNILLWSTSDNGHALTQLTDEWLRNGTDLRRIMIALHMDSFPFRNKAEMEQVLSELAIRHPTVHGRCYELIAAWSAISE